MKIRSYQESDCVEITDLFHGSVHSIDNSAYSKEELEAWSPTPPDYGFWKQRLEIKQPFVACENNIIIGFIELEPDGHIDCLYVHKHHQGLGVANGLLQHTLIVAIERGISYLYVEASKVAVPLFKKYGFNLQQSNKVKLRGELLTNYSMSLTLKP
jgi:putative acetyltransferase